MVWKQKFYGVKIKAIEHMTKKKLYLIEKKINSIKQDIMKIGEMRPGSLTKQYKNSKDKIGAFYQLSYTYKMKSKTEYVRPQFAKDIKNQIKNYKRFKKLIENWIDLAIDHSKLKKDIAKRIDLK
jgi:hypothetical protein